MAGYVTRSDEPGQLVTLIIRLEKQPDRQRQKKNPANSNRRIMLALLERGQSVYQRFRRRSHVHFSPCRFGVSTWIGASSRCFVRLLETGQPSESLRQFTAVFLLHDHRAKDWRCLRGFTRFSKIEIDTTISQFAFAIHATWFLRLVFEW